MLILLTFLTIKLYFYYDVPEYSGNKSLTALQDTVEVFTDSYGVPNVFANNNEDLFFTAGYVIARERLFQLSLHAAVARGEILELLGDGYAEHDNYIKQNKLFSISHDNATAVNPENELLIQAYCSGINTWIDETEETLPLSFKILNSRPLKWTSSDVINVASMMTGNLYQNRQDEWFLNKIGQYFGETKLLEILTIETFRQINAEKDYSVGPINKRSLELENQIRELVGATDQFLQKDVIILPKEQTAFQKPILLFKDTWGLRQPAKWYDMHLSGGDFNVEGAVIPGFPLPLIGKNHNTAWAITGQVTAEVVNDLFDYSGNSIINEPNSSISYADTSGFYVEDRSRIRQGNLLQERLMDLDKISIDDIITRLHDTKNPRKAEIAHRIVKIYLDNNFSNKTPMNMLYEWDGDESLSSEMLLINVIYKKLLENIFMDEFSLVGEDVFDIFINMPILTEQSINMILNNGEASWVDDIKTVDYQENLAEMITKAVNEALVEIKKDLGNNIQNWQGINAKTYKHILYGKSFLAKLFNLNIKADVGNDSYNHISGTSLRRIFDLSDMSTSYSILPTGQSELPKSAHYADQMELFNKHSFRKIEFNEVVIRNSDKYQKFVLCPVE